MPLEVSCKSNEKGAIGWFKVTWPNAFGVSHLGTDLFLCVTVPRKSVFILMQKKCGVGCDTM